VVGITGTRGKSTTTTIVAKMLEASRKHVWLGGNILVSPLTFLDKVKKKDLVVLELSSFQLEGTGAAGISPHVACWTNLMNDHQNAYGSMEEYAEAKAQILRHQTKNDIVVLNGDNDVTAAEIKNAPSQVFVFTAKKTKRSDAWLTDDALMLKSSSSQEGVLMKKAKLRVHGEHMYLNMLAAALTARAAGARLVGMRKALADFKGLEHRQEVVMVKKGVTYVNDTTATTPDGAIAALRAFSAKDRTIRLILGGADKELDFTELAQALKDESVDIVLLPGTAHAKLVAALRRQGVAFEEALTLREAVRSLKKRAKAGDVVLLSPACASFGLFQNEFDRGNQFKKMIGKKGAH
jgi:UDP-N-acetylmuramoylalanine--D-glutamate ligase